MEGAMSPEFIRAASALQLTTRWMTPFLRISNNCPRNKILTAFLEPFATSGIPVTVQLMGTAPEPIAEAAARFRDSGGAGGGILKTPELAADIIAAIRRRIGLFPLSVKMRTGWENPAEQERLIPLFVAAGADRLFIHFRTVCELYAPTPQREERLCRSVQLANSVPVIVNGDINSPDDAFQLKNITGAAGVMIARGWFRDPRLLRRIAGFPSEPSPEEARLQLWNAVTNPGFKQNRAIELSILLWGPSNPFLLSFRREKKVGKEKLSTGDLS